MLYFETTSFEKHIELLKYLSQNDDYEAIIWFFPESKLRNICNLKLAPKGLNQGEQVTEYGDDLKPKKTRRVTFNKDLVAKIKDSAKHIKLNCDSIALYKKGENLWSACVIQHEKMSLIRNEKEQENLIARGFEVTNKPPEWW